MIMTKVGDTSGSVAFDDEFIIDYIDRYAHPIYRGNNTYKYVDLNGTSSTSTKRKTTTQL